MTQLLSLMRGNLPRYMALACAGVIILLPFHAFLTVWAASGLGHYTALRLWKEFVLVVLVAGVLVLLGTRPELRAAVRREKLLWLMAAYALLVIGLGLIALLAGGVSLKAYAYGVLLDTRFLVFFAVTWAVAQYDDLLVRLWRQILLIPAAVVSAIALLQYAVLPADVLRHFGYGPNTIPANAMIDQQAAYRRVQSTLRGPNPLGAYQVLILSSLGVLLLRIRKSRTSLVIAYLAAGLALVFTFSRSAWLGALVAMLALVWLSVRSADLRRYLVVVAVSFVLVFSGVVYLLRDNDHFQNVFFHTSERSKSMASSNEGHLGALLTGLTDVAFAPWGSGAGTAGPASIYNKHAPRIAENYYVQIGQETGILGVVMFVTILVVLARRLWTMRGSSLGLTLLVSFAGLVVVNLLLHGWADDTLAYIWWGLAGAAIGSAGKDTYGTQA